MKPARMQRFFSFIVTGILAATAGCGGSGSSSYQQRWLGYSDKQHSSNHRQHWSLGRPSKQLPRCEFCLHERNRLRSRQHLQLPNHQRRPCGHRLVGTTNPLLRPHRFTSAADRLRRQSGCRVPSLHRWLHLGTSANRGYDHRRRASQKSADSSDRQRDFLQHPKQLLKQWCGRGQPRKPRRKRHFGRRHLCAGLRRCLHIDRLVEPRLVLHMSVGLLSYHRKSGQPGRKSCDLFCRR